MIKENKLLNEAQKIENSQKLAKQHGSIALSGFSALIHQQREKGITELSDYIMDQLRAYASLLDFIIKSSLLASGKDFMHKKLKDEDRVEGLFEDYYAGIKRLDQNSINSFYAYTSEAFDTNFLITLHWK